MNEDTGTGDTKAEREGLIAIEVAIAFPGKQRIRVVKVTEGTSAREAFIGSRIWEEFDHLEAMQSFDPYTQALGKFGLAFGSRGLASAESYCVVKGDRIEMLRPLINDPKETRRRRAALQKAKQKNSGR